MTIKKKNSDFQGHEILPDAAGFWSKRGTAGDEDSTELCDKIVKEGTMGYVDDILVN